MIREGEWMDDDLIRGVGPMQVAVPFLPGILGSHCASSRTMSWVKRKCSIGRKREVGAKTG